MQKWILNSINILMQFEFQKGSRNGFFKISFVCVFRRCHLNIYISLPTFSV